MVVLEIDVEGASQVKEKMPNAFAIFILPPSDEELLLRLRGRKREHEQVIQGRFNKARSEIARAQAGGIYDQFLINDDLPSALSKAVELVNRERTQRLESD